MSKTKLGLLALPAGSLEGQNNLAGIITGVSTWSGTLTVDSPGGENHVLEGTIAGTSSLFCLGRQLQVAHSLLIFPGNFTGVNTFGGALSVSSPFTDNVEAAQFLGIGFWIAEADSSGNILMNTARRLSPGPTTVRYPERFAVEPIPAKDGSTVLKGALVDGRQRSWIWKRYRSSVPKYDVLYNRLLNYHYKLRQKANPSNSPYVYIRDTESGNLTIRSWNGDQWIETEPWIRVKVTQVTRSPAAGGRTVYDETVLSFVIDDDSWNNF